MNELQKAARRNEGRQTSSKTWMLLRSIPTVFIAVIAEIIILGLLSPASLAPSALLSLVRQSAVLGIVAIAQTLVMIEGGIDLSATALIMLVEIFSAQFMAGNASRIVPVIILCLALGAVVGTFNGLAVVVLRVAPFIVTLGVSFLLLGLTLIITGGAPKGELPLSFRWIAIGNIGPVPVAGLFWVIAIFVSWLMLQHTVFGRRLFAVGNNKQAAMVSGVNVALVRISTYGLAGLLVSFAGLILSAYIGVGTLRISVDYVFQSILAAVLGGTTFIGGVGGLIGTIGGVLFISFLGSILAVLYLPISARLILNGLLLVAVLMFYSSRSSRIRT